MVSLNLAHPVHQVCVYVSASCLGAFQRELARATEELSPGQFLDPDKEKGERREEMNDPRAEDDQRKPHKEVAIKYSAVEQKVNNKVT